MADELPAPTADPRAEMALLRAANAPVIFFEVASTHGVRNGVANITLEGGMHVLHQGKVLTEPLVVAHLRFPIAAISTLRASLDAIELLLKPAASGEKN